MCIRDRLYITNELLKKFGDSLEGKIIDISGSGNVATYAIQKATQLGAKVVTCSDSTGWVYDPDGIDVDLLIELKQVKRARISEYVKSRPNAVYYEGRGLWTTKCDIAIPCATQNELLIDDAKALVANGCKYVVEGANTVSYTHLDVYKRQGYTSPPQSGHLPSTSCCSVKNDSHALQYIPL